MAGEKEQGDFPAQKLCSAAQVAEEMKELWGMALPMTAMNCLVFLRAAVSVLFLGRLGSLELAGGSLSIGFTNITGYSVLVGLASGLEPVCSQAYGSRNWDLLYLSLHRMVLILLAAAVPVALLWLNLEGILLAAGQDPEITAMAATYCLYSLPDLLTNAILQPLRVYLRSQQVAKPMMYCSLAAVALHAPLNAVMVGPLRMGVAGVAVASVLTNLNMALLMTAYVCAGGGFGRWAAAGWRRRREGIGPGLGPLLRLAIPSCLGICLEWWWYEIVTILAGYLPEPKLAVAATGILTQTTSLMYTVPMALAGCVSARVGNELGAGKPQKAKLAAAVALGCALLVGALNVVWTAALGRRWAGVFTGEEPVRALVASVMPVLGACELGNCPQTTGCGVLRGTARPGVGARINLWAFYMVGTPVAVGLAFGLRLGFAGLWFGLLSAQAACVASVVFVVSGTDWEGEAAKAKQMTGGCGRGEEGIDGSEEMNGAS